MRSRHVLLLCFMKVLEIVPRLLIFLSALLNEDKDPPATLTVFAGS